MHWAKNVLSVGETVSTLLDTCVPESTCYKIVKPLVDDHPLLRPLQSDFEGGRKRGVLLYRYFGVVYHNMYSVCIYIVKSC